MKISNIISLKLAIYESKKYYLPRLPCLFPALLPELNTAHARARNSKSWNKNKLSLCSQFSIFKAIYLVFLLSKQKYQNQHTWILLDILVYFTNHKGLLFTNNKKINIKFVIICPKVCLQKMKADWFISTFFVLYIYESDFDYNIDYDGSLKN